MVVLIRYRNELRWRQEGEGARMQREAETWLREHASLADGRRDDEFSAEFFTAEPPD